MRSVSASDVLLVALGLAIVVIVVLRLSGWHSTALQVTAIIVALIIAAADLIVRVPATLSASTSGGAATTSSLGVIAPIHRPDPTVASIRPSHSNASPTPRSQVATTPTGTPIRSLSPLHRAATPVVLPSPTISTRETHSPNPEPIAGVTTTEETVQTSGIESITFTGTPKAPIITAIGSGFGSLPKHSPDQAVWPIPGSGYDFGELLIIRDHPGTSHEWAAGEWNGKSSAHDYRGLIIQEYSPTRVSFTLGSTYPGYYTRGLYRLDAGDSVQLTIKGTRCAAVADYAGGQQPCA